MNTVKEIKILGISAYYHDSAAAIICEGEIIAAAQEERFTRKKHDEELPINAIKYCLKESNTCIEDLDYIVFYEKPLLKFDRLLETYFAYAPTGFKNFKASLPIWIKDKLFQKENIIETLKNNFQKSKKSKFPELLFSEHHISHAASAFYPSPFEEAAILTMDGVGEWATTSLSIGKKQNLTKIKEIKFPHSLGLLYSAFTYYCGFKVNSGEYKLMGLAPYGDPKYVNLIKSKLIDIKEDGSFKLDMSYFGYCQDLKMTTPKFNELFGGRPRSPETNITQREMDIAASIQMVTEEVVLKLAYSIREKTGQKNICLAGGVALNCVANGKLVKEKIFENVWIQPASGDAGGALGAALAVYYMHLGKSRENLEVDRMKGSYLGPSYTQDEIFDSLKELGAVFTSFTNERELINETAQLLAKGESVGWHQGRMEFGPRALGARSIIADPRSEFMQKQLNLKIKFRESFRPFAPSVLKDKASDWFDLYEHSPYMLITCNVKDDKKINLTRSQESLFGIDKLNIVRSKIPAVTHVDYSARVQTVDGEYNEIYYKLLKRFEEITGCPILVNTSFNVRGEPIVNTPADAYRCFMSTGLDVLVLGNFILRKKEQDPAKLINYQETYELD